MAAFRFQAAVLSIPLGFSLARIYRNLTDEPDRTQTPQSSEKKHAAAATLASRSITAERVGCWSDEKLEKMIQRNSICKQNEDHLREMHTKAKESRALGA